MGRFASSHFSASTRIGLLQRSYREIILRKRSHASEGDHEAASSDSRERHWLQAAVGGQKATQLHAHFPHHHFQYKSEEKLLRLAW